MEMRIEMLDVEQLIAALQSSGLMLRPPEIYELFRREQIDGRALQLFAKRDAFCDLGIGKGNEIKLREFIESYRIVVGDPQAVQNAVAGAAAPLVERPPAAAAAAAASSSSPVSSSSNTRRSTEKRVRVERGSGSVETDSVDAIAEESTPIIVDEAAKVKKMRRRSLWTSSEREILVNFVSETGLYGSKGWDELQRRDKWSLLHSKTNRELGREWANLTKRAASNASVEDLVVAAKASIGKKRNKE